MNVTDANSTARVGWRCTFLARSSDLLAAGGTLQLSSPLETTQRIQPSARYQSAAKSALEGSHPSRIVRQQTWSGSAHRTIKLLLKLTLTDVRGMQNATGPTGVISRENVNHPSSVGLEPGMMMVSPAWALRFDLVPDGFEAWTDRASDECPTTVGLYDGPLTADGPAGM